MLDDVTAIIFPLIFSSLLLKLCVCISINAVIKTSKFENKWCPAIFQTSFVPHITPIFIANDLKNKQEYYIKMASAAATAPVAVDGALRTRVADLVQRSQALFDDAYPCTATGLDVAGGYVVCCV